MRIIKIISEHKHIPKNKPVAKGKKRVEAVVEIDGYIQTCHLDIPKENYEN